MADQTGDELSLKYHLIIPPACITDHAQFIYSYGLSDPFVVVKLNGVPFARTSTKSNTSSPRWFDACFEVPVFKRISEPIVSFEVWDMDSDGVGDFLGEGEATSPNISQAL